MFLASIGCGPSVRTWDGQGGDGAGGNLTTSGTGGSASCTSMLPGNPIRGQAFFPQVGPTVSALRAPPAISGGTLRVLRDGTTAVAADPDRDRVYVVDLAARAVTATVSLQPGDEPGRVAEDGAGRAHVALRHGGALVTIVPATGEIAARREVCAAPRGVAYDPATDLLHVACAGGELVSLPADGGPAVRTLLLDHDLRDVMVDGSRLRVTRFRSADLVTVEADGSVSGRLALPGFRAPETRGGQLFSPAVAWRAVASPKGGAVVLHQRGVDDPILPSAGGYAGQDICNTIVQTAVTTVGGDGQMTSGPALVGLVLAVDMALSADGSKIAIVSAGNATNAEAPGSPPSLPRLFVTDTQSATDPTVGCRSDGMHGPCLPLGLANGGGITSLPAPDPGSAGGTSGAEATPPPDPSATTCGSVPPSPTVPNVVGQPIAVAFDPAGNVIVQSREPALLELPGGNPIVLATDSRADTGHALFHANAGSFIACASCHAEGNEDGRTWRFTSCQGATPRRTQSLQVGLRGSEPFHWAGEEHDFSALMQDVFVGRMSGPMLGADQGDAILSWIDAQPRPALSPPADAAAVERGRALFADPARAACATCHAGAHFTNNVNIDVGTGGAFQVPSLVGIGSRGPYMHDGCAQTLRDRFGACGGGDRHGATSMLSASEIADLVSYLQTL